MATYIWYELDWSDADGGSFPLSEWAGELSNWESDDVEKIIVSDNLLVGFFTDEQRYLIVWKE